MRNIIVTLSLFFCCLTAGFSQDINFFTDANFRLFKFEKGVFEKIYYQQTSEIFAGNDYICFVDSKGDIYVYHDGETHLMGQSYDEINVTDNLLVMNTANVIRIFDRGIKHILTPNASGYAYGDSVVIFQDVIGGYVKYYYQDEVREIAMFVGNYPMPESHIGANTFIYKDNTGAYSVFWRGEFKSLISSNQAVPFACGQDVVAYNDPQTGTFTIFDNGYIVDAEDQFVERFECGNNFVYYKDVAGNHKVYREENVTEIGYDIQNVIVRDSLVVFNDIGLTRIWYNDETYQIFNDVVNSPQIDGGIMAYSNKWGGVSAFVRGEEVEITRQRVEEFKLQGNTIMLKFSRTAFSCWWNGTIYEFE